MQRRKIPVACIQTAAHDRDGFEIAWPRIASLVERAAISGARLVVLPEGTVPAYVLGSRPVDGAVLAAAERDLAAIAKLHALTIVYGAAKVEAGVTYNAALALGPDGNALGFAAKQFLWHFDRKWFSAGTALLPVDTPLGRLGLLVCADGRIPSIAATLVERGAELLVMPTAWVTSGRDPQQLENIQADLMAGVRARENGVPFAVANKCGVELATVAYCGKSSLVDARGTVVARGSERDEEIVTADLEIGPSLATARTPFEPAAPALEAALVRRARIAITPARDAAEIASLDLLAKQADASVLVVAEDAAGEGSGRTLTIGGLRACAVSAATLDAPRGLVPARLAGYDVFLCAAAAGDAAWLLRTARTRAAELRAYVIVFASASRAYAIDPDGAVVAGTYPGYRMAAFVYDRARSEATEVAPGTDVLAGLRAAEALRRGEVSSRREPREALA